jgi:hypothetical protein
MCIGKIWFFIVFAVFIASCGSGGKGGTSGGQSSSSSSGALKISENCTKLDPNRVYLLGQFGRETEFSNSFAVADPANPWDYCVGFDDPAVINTTNIAADGRLYFAKYIPGEKITVYSFVSESLIKDSAGLWKMPESLLGNDMIVHEKVTRCGFTSVFLQKETNDIFYDCPKRTINSLTEDGIYDIGDNYFNKLLTVTKDASQLVYTFDEKLKIVDSLGRETILSMPNTIPIPICETAKQFYDIASGTDKIWVSCYDYVLTDENMHRRYTVDLDKETVVDDGPLMGFPSDVGPISHAGKFDGQGNFWQRARSLSNPANDVIVKRPIKGISTIVYTEASYNGTGNWRKDKIPFVMIGSSEQVLITGP